MNKDVIYIDVDDDVTAIISKIKKAKEKVVALVPPKRSGALQSIVNLRLLARMAKAEHKHLVLVTNHQALIALAATAEIPVAKNLQSRPELAEVPELEPEVEEDDIIDGSQIPIGEHAATVKAAKTAKTTKADKASDTYNIPDESRNDAIDETDLNIDGEDVAVASAESVKRTRVAAKQNKNRPKIPNFDSFRKKFFLIIVAGAALTALLIWMYVVAPAATVILTASTTPMSVSSTIQLGGTASTDYEKGIVSSVSRQDKVDETTTFQATGEKDAGDKATGTLEVTYLTENAYTLPSGSRFTTSSGFVFLTQDDVVIPASVACFPSYCAQSASVDVIAEKPGTKYNGVTGSVTGSSGASGVFDSATSGGTTDIVKVVTADDIERARGVIIGQSTSDQEAALTKELTNGEIVVKGSFTVERGNATSSPAEGEVVPNGEATLILPTTYTVQAVQQADLESYLSSYLKSKLDDQSSQKVYSTGIDAATLSNFKQQDGVSYATINANGAVGPSIDEANIKEQAAGKRYGDVQQTLQSINGIQEVDVQFSYFWVRTVPNDTNKISVEFKVNNE